MNRIKTYSLIIFCCLVNSLTAQVGVPEIRYISYNVNTGNIDVRWNAVSGATGGYYDISYGFWYPDQPDLTGGFSLIGTVPASSDLTFSFNPVDEITEFDPTSQPIMIGVQAFNSSGDNIGKYDTAYFDRSIYLEADFDSCLASVELTWNAYTYKQLPQPGTSLYKLYVSENNGVSYNLYGTIPANNTSYNIQDLDPKKDYKILISAMSANYASDSANSNIVEVNTEMTVLPKYMYANSANYNNGGAALSFSIDPASETQTYNLLRSTKRESEFEQIYQFNTSEKELKYTDNSIDYLSQPYYYKIEVINNCDVNIRESDNTASTIVLNNTGEPLIPKLSWNRYIEFLRGVDNYTIERKFGNNEYKTISSQSENTFTDNEIQDLVEQNYVANVCYKVTAHEIGGNNSSLSNEICVDLPVNIRFEYDAFMPGSSTTNNTFGPTIDFIPDEYVFKVLDRNGRVVYQSKDPENTKWDGYTNGILAQEGVYMVVIQYRIGGGKKQSVSGAVVVVR